MNFWKTLLGLAVLLAALSACKEQTKAEDVVETAVATYEPAVEKSTAQLKAELTEAGFELFDYVDQETGDTVIMQKYFIAFLKSGPNRSQSKEVADSLQALHMEHLGRMYYEGYADISGPFDDDSDIQGITIYNVPTFEMADSLANMDPMVKAGRLVIEVHPWWAAKGFPLR